MPIVGSFAGASSRAYGLQAGVLVGDFESISTVTVGSGGSSTIEFTSIPQTYTHLQLRGISRFSAAVGESNIQTQFNNDTAANYSDHLLIGTGSAAASGGDANMSFTYTTSTPGANISANIFGVAIIDILDYANTNKYKTYRSINGWDGNGSGIAGLWSGNWRSTSAITSIKLTARVGNFVEYSSFALYGIKG